MIVVVRFMFKLLKFFYHWRKLILIAANSVFLEFAAISNRYSKKIRNMDSSHYLHFLYAGI